MRNLKYHIKKIKDKISSGAKVLIITHVNPDGDAIGSSLGLYHCLKKITNTNVITPNDFPEFLKWLPGADKIFQFEKHKKHSIALINNADIIFILDLNILNRLEKIQEYYLQARGIKILIDHHPQFERFAHYYYTSINVSSTAELVWQFIKKCKFQKYIDKDVAENIYVGIMTDTGSFSYNSSSPSTFYIVANLLKYGINKDDIYEKVYNKFTAERWRLLGYCLEKKMVVLPQYKTAYISINKDELKKYKFQLGDSEGFVNYPLSIQGINFAAVFIELKDYIKISFRSKGNFAVNEFSRAHFNGGGHKNAAGGSEQELSLEETKEKFIKLLPLYKGKLY